MVLGWIFGAVRSAIGIFTDLFGFVKTPVDAPKVVSAATPSDSASSETNKILQKIYDKMPGQAPPAFHIIEATPVKNESSKQVYEGAFQHLIGMRNRPCWQFCVP